MEIGRYRIVRELGRGAMGVVYHALDPNIGRAVAVKTIKLGDVTNTQERARLKERLFREARSAGMLSHPGIVTIYDVDQQGELAYIAMEFVDGPTLDDLMSRSEPLPPQQMFAILGQTAVALDYAHGKGIVHRDVKPANIMIDPEGSAKITDFGIAKITASEQFTMTGTIIGTPHYMAPEQVQGHTVDGRADQFSLAVMAFEMLTGDKPFTGEQLTTVVYKIVAEEPAPVARFNATLTAGIEAALRRGLAKKPEARYRNCQELVDALEGACAASKGWKSLPRGGSMSAPTVAEAPRVMREMPPPRVRHRAEDTAPERRRVGVLPVAMALLVAAGLVGLIAWQATPWLSGTVAKQAESAPAPAAAAPPPAPAEPEMKRPSAVGPPQAPPPEVKPAVVEKPAEPEPETRRAARGGETGRAGSGGCDGSDQPGGGDGRARRPRRYRMPHAVYADGHARPPHGFDHAARPPDRAPRNRGDPQPAGAAADFAARHVGHADAEYDAARRHDYDRRPRVAARHAGAD